MQARCFFVAGAALCDVAFRDVVTGAAFCDVAKVLFPQITLAVTCKRDTSANIVEYCAWPSSLSHFGA